MRSGYVNENGEVLDYAGLSGYYWSLLVTPNSLPEAYNLNFNTVNIAPTSPSAMLRGFAERKNLRIRVLTFCVQCATMEL